MGAQAVGLAAGHQPSPESGVGRRLAWGPAASPGWQNPNRSPRNFPPPVPMETRNFLLPKVELLACALCPTRAPLPEPHGTMVWWELLVRLARYLRPCLRSQSPAVELGQRRPPARSVPVPDQDVLMGGEGPRRRIVTCSAHPVTSTAQPEKMSSLLGK